MPIRKIKNPKSFDLCRVCKHYYLSHTDIAHQPSFCHNITMSCKCKEFLPEDNLEFLEYEYRKRK
jgi:hypothetical protein